jgi:hypothetical protein
MNSRHPDFLSWRIAVHSGEVSEISSEEVDGFVLDEEHGLDLHGRLEEESKLGEIYAIPSIATNSERLNLGIEYGVDRETIRSDMKGISFYAEGSMHRAVVLGEDIIKRLLVLYEAAGICAELVEIPVADLNGRRTIQEVHGADVRSAIVRLEDALGGIRRYVADGVSNRLDRVYGPVADEEPSESGEVETPVFVSAPGPSGILPRNLLRYYTAMGPRLYTGLKLDVLSQMIQGNFDSNRLLQRARAYPILDGSKPHSIATAEFTKIDASMRLYTASILCSKYELLSLKYLPKVESALKQLGLSSKAMERINVGESLSQLTGGPS